MELDYRSQGVIVQPITDRGDALLGCQLIKQMADELAFTALQREQINIAAKEITSNLLLHKTVNPTLAIYKVQQPDKQGLSLVASDHGPGIASISQAMTDRHSTRGGMGCGLGAIKRMMDEFAINSVPPQAVSRLQSHAAGGTTLIASKWCTHDPQQAPRFQWGGVSRPKPGYADNGDAYFLKETETTIHLFVCDGLGHGPDAAAASQQALTLAQQDLGLPLPQLFTRLHEALRGSRGVAMMAMQLDKASRQLTWCGVGNIEAALLPREAGCPLSQPGVLGSGRLPTLQCKSLHWPTNGTLILHSDGVSRRWRDDPLLNIQEHDPLLTSHLILRDYGRHTDDATVLTLMERNRP